MDMSGDYDYELEVFLDPDTVENPPDALGRRLQNLGYGTGEPVEHQIEAFQRDRGLAWTRDSNDVAQELTQCHDECRPPFRGIEDGGF